MNVLITLGYMALIFMASTIPDVEATHNFLTSVPSTVQNMLHMPVYGFLALLLILNLRAYGFTERRCIFVALAISLAYGAGLELYQAYVPGRFSSAMDLVTDLVGVIAFVLLYLLVRPYGFWSSKKVA